MSPNGQPVSSSPSEAGVDQGGHTPDPPAADWSQPGHLSEQSLSQIHERMDELSQQTTAIADALGQSWGSDNGYGDDGHEDDGYDYEDDGEDLEGLTPEQYAAYEAEHGGEVDAIANELGESGEGEVLDRLAAQIEQRLGHQQDAERALEDRHEAFEDLREALPVLQDEQTAMRVVHAAKDIAERWNPQLVDGPEFVQLVELVALASIAEQAAARERSAPPVRHVQLEGASGARPPEPTEPDWGSRILDAAERIRPRI